MKKFFGRRRSKTWLAVDQAGLTFSEPNESEKTWMAGHLQLAANLNIDVDDIAHVASFYELLLRSWRDSPADRRSDPNVSINAIGTVFGEHLVRKTVLKWVVASDRFGTEHAVHDAATDTLVSPANAVSKRWSTGSSGEFIGLICSQVSLQVGPRRLS
ncbi:DUF3806 domain-containing protein [Rathayibacter iranicus]|uniref:DUF3806 domain-containing protein n=2 Tax=Rathayibacter iranicus TaxID=59737 RepID=A0AAD1ACC8_9MICO|nr:DUF3806 domain-containing protein [Rathayibacter iranicus]AZZ54790.1 DUF3806 domain-containing protein [Rathayibacter iranicus]MWV31354.1 DUF3806 domain-containing protein [Rathayibacter iranicus NCPPB 2253 = VKM Ac-1602]PPI50382.1 hypothetical protein C5E09_02035 [Rathayibacter iranicus]PPI62709.1 hypothetical protein C5E08_02040 [Rathayibacter iranicus]PPI73782.1 hypothetical protein C5E01_02015 [Rathayibacter iranicus]